MSQSANSLLDQENDYPTPLHEAIIKNDIAEINQLVQEGAPIDAYNKNGFAPIHIAAINRNNAALDILIAAKACIDFPDQSNRTALHFAASNVDSMFIEKLIQNNADINALDIYAKTPLHYAIEYNQIEAVNQLINKNVINIDAQDEQGRTPLHYAFYYENPSIQKLLIDQKANQNIEDGKGYIPADCTERFMFGEKVNRFPSKEGETLGQTEGLDKVRDAVDWMRQYEQHRYKEENEQRIDSEKKKPPKLDEKFLTQPFLDYDGICVALSTRISEAAIMGNVEGFVTNVRNAFSTNPPTLDGTSPEDKQKAKEYYERMNLFLLLSVQMQAGDGRNASTMPSSQALETFFEAADGVRKLRDTYIFTENEQLLEWAKKANPKESIMIDTTKHRMAMYVDLEKDTKRRIVGFYDPNKKELCEYYQDSLKGIPEQFNPFIRLYNPDEKMRPILICQEVIANDNINSSLNIKDSFDNLNFQEHIYVILEIGRIGHATSMQKLIELPTPINDEELKILSNKAALCFNKSILRKFIDENIPLHPDIIKKFGQNPLESIHFATYHRDVPFLESCIANGQNVNQLNGYGSAALHLAALDGKVPTIEALLKNNADINIKNKNNETPLDLAVKANNEQAVKLLITYKAEIDLSKYTNTLAPIQQMLKKGGPPATRPKPRPHPIIL